MDKFLKSPGKRILCFKEYGDPNGIPIFVFHGNPNSRLLWGVLPARGMGTWNDSMIPGTWSIPLEEITTKVFYGREKKKQRK